MQEKDVPSLDERNFAETVNKQDCIVMYYNSGPNEEDAEARGTYGMSAQRLGDEWMLALRAFQQKHMIPLRLYKVNWKDFSSESLGTIRVHTESILKKPESPSFVAYRDGGGTRFAVRGPARPDQKARFVNEMMANFVVAVKTEQGELLWQGWEIPDTKIKYINVVDARKDEMVFNGVKENVQVVTNRSVVYNGYSCSYESIYSGSRVLLGISESCGKKGTVRYFDYEKSGKMRYRLRGPAAGANATSGQQPALPAR